MMILATKSARIALFVTALLAPRAAHAQCTDWVDGFGYPGNGLPPQAAEPRAAATYDDGTGPALYLQSYVAPSGQYLRRFDGTSWSNVPGITPVNVGAMIVYDAGAGSELYVSGNFTLSTGVSKFAKWNGSTWSDLSGTLDGDISALCIHDDGTGPALYAGGIVATAVGQPYTNVLKFQGGTWSTLGSGVDGRVECLTSYASPAGPVLVAGGLFTHAGALIANRIAKWNGTAWSTIGASGAGGSNTDVLALQVMDFGSGPQLFVGGEFTFMGGVSAMGIARWNGTAWSSIGALGGRVGAMADFDDGSGHKLYVTGTFGSIGGVIYSQIARWDGSAWSQVQGGMGSSGYVPVRSMNRVGSLLYVTGSLQSAGGKPAAKVAAFGTPCSMPVVVQDPHDTTASFPQDVHLDATFSGVLPMTYQWRHNGNPIANVTDAVIGAQTQHLILAVWSYNDAGTYDCVATNALGSATTSTATLTVPAGGLSGVPVSLTKILYPPATANGLLPGETITDFSLSVQARTGEVVIQGKINGSVWGLFLWQSGTLTLIARVGDAAAQLPAGVTYESFRDYFVGDNGCVGFKVTLAGPGVGPTNREAIYFRDAQGTALAMRLGDPAPGSVTNGVFSQFVNTPVMGPGGHLANWCSVTVNGVFQQSGLWIWSRANGALPVARSGDPAPGTTHTYLNSDVAPVIDVAGRITFAAQLEDHSFALFTGVPGAVQKILAKGEQMPGLPAGTFTEEGGRDYLSNDSGDVVFRTYSTAGGNTWVTYAWSNGVLTPIVLAGASAPGVPSSKTFFSATPVGFNTAGTVALRGDLQGSCTGTCPDRGVWLWKPTGLVPVCFDHGVPYPEIPVEWPFYSFSSVALGEDDHVLVGVTFSYGQFFTSMFGWTEVSGIFPLAVPGSQIEIDPGTFGTVAGSSPATVDGGVLGPVPSTGLSATGTGVLDLDFTNHHSGVFSGEFAHLLGLYFPCAMVITQPPAGTFALAGQDVSLSMTASGGGILQYRWSRNGVDMFDDGHVTGTGTPTLVIHGSVANDSATYAARVFNICGVDETHAAWVDVGPGIPYCFGDGSAMACPCGNASAIGPGLGCLNSLGLGGRLRASGTASLTNDTLALDGRNMPNSSALYFQGTTQVNGGLGVVFGDGLRCAGGSVTRLGIATNSSGASAYPGGGTPISVKGGVTAPGSVRTYQAWYRNSGSFCTSGTYNLTNGYSVVWSP